MPDVWSRLSQGRDGVMARGADVLRRTRETGAGVLGRAEQRASGLKERLATRRAGLNGRPIERVERRVLSGIESILDRMGLGLRLQIRRLAPDAPRSGERTAIAREGRAELAPEMTTARSAKKRRMKIAVRDVPPATKRPRAKARPAARSTRWVTPPTVDVGELAKLPAKALVARLGELSEEERRALLDHERANKNRKTVLAALGATLPS